MKKATTGPVQLTLKSGNSLSKAFGISEARRVELMNISQRATDKAKGRVSNLLLEISKHCNNPNELAVSAFVVGKAIADAHTDQALMAALGALSKMSKKK